jgi:flagellar motor component MotA|tara:strand:+ start:6754 stop:7023 length:270 start_codon:yes stop_codon:yes gene_type:complete
MKLLKNKNGVSLAQLVGIAITFVIVAVTLGVGGDILDEISDDATENTTKANATEKGGAALNQISDWLPTLGLVVAAAVVIGVLVSSFRT